MVKEKILNEGLFKKYIKEDLESFRKVEVTEDDVNLLQKLYNTSGLTILGLLDSESNLDKFKSFIDKYSNPIDNIPIYVISGDLMNKIYNLQGIKKYPKDLKIIVVSLADLNDIDPELFRVRYNISNSGWFDDIVEDNKQVLNYGDENLNSSLINEDFDTKYRN